MDISSLINKIKGAKKSKEEKQKEIINEKIKDIEKIYEKVKKEKGKEKAIEEVTEMLKDFLSRSEDQELNAIIRGIKYDTTVPVSELVEDIAITSAQEAENPDKVMETLGEVAPDRKIVELVENSSDIPLEHKEILAKGIQDDKTRTKIKREIKTEAEKRKEKEDLKKLQKIYNEETDKEDLGDQFLQAEILKLNLNDEGILKLNLDMSSERIKQKIYQILARRMANNYMRFGDTSLSQFSCIVQPEDLFADNFETIVEQEYDKKTKKEKEESKFKFSKKDIEANIRRQMVKSIASFYQEYGKFNIPQSERMKELSAIDKRQFIKEIEAEIGKSLTIMQERDIRAQMEGKIVDNVKIEQFEKATIDTKKEKRDFICDLGISMAENETMYNTIKQLEQEGIIEKLANMPKDYRNSCIEIIGQTLDGALSQFLKKESKAQEQAQDDTGR